MNVKLSERNRASGNLRRSSLQCDHRNLPTIGQWHQFVGDAGTKMPNSCVPTQRCGTHAPGWMQGKHPKKEEGAVFRKVCFHWSGNCCRWSVQIKVRNCDGYYVYKLERPPTCYLRFCGDKGHGEWYWMVCLWVVFQFSVLYRNCLWHAELIITVKLLPWKECEVGVSRSKSHLHNLIGKWRRRVNARSVIFAI